MRNLAKWTAQVGILVAFASVLMAQDLYAIDDPIPIGRQPAFAASGVMGVGPENSTLGIKGATGECKVIPDEMGILHVKAKLSFELPTGEVLTVEFDTVDPIKVVDKTENIARMEVGGKMTLTSLATGDVLLEDDFEPGGPFDLQLNANPDRDDGKIFMTIFRNELGGDLPFNIGLSKGTLFSVTTDGLNSVTDNYTVTAKGFFNIIR